MTSSLLINPNDTERKLFVLGDPLQATFDPNGGSTATVLAAIDIADPLNITSFTRGAAMGYSGSGETALQREAAVDTLRSSHYVGGVQGVLLEVESVPSQCALVAPGTPSVTPGELKFSATYSAIAVTTSRLRYEYRLDGTGSWTTNGTSTTLTDIAASAGSHTLEVRAVSTSGVAGATATSASFTVLPSSTITKVQSKSKSDMFNSTTFVEETFDVAVSNGGLIDVCAIWSSATATVAFSDNQENTYSLHASSKVAASGYSIQKGYAKSVTGGTVTVRATFSGAVTNKAITMVELSGPSATSPVGGQKATNVGSVGAGTNAIDSGTFTTSANGAYIVASMFSQSFSGSTATAGTLSEAYTLLETQNGNGQMFYTEGARQTTASASSKATFTPAGFTGGVFMSVAAYIP